MFKQIVIFIAVSIFLLPFGQPSQMQSPSQEFPDWAYNLHLWPFDILYPDTTAAEIDERLNSAQNAQANAVIVYIEEEHMYGTFVDDAGFAHMLTLISDVVAGAHERNLRVLVYLNGLEVMTHDAVDPSTCEALSGETMARVHPDWLQYDLDGEPIVYTCLDAEWVTPDMEDAWLSPASPYLGLFQSRLTALGTIGVDGVYIDATFMPGLQLDDEEPRWGSTDERLSAQFEMATGYAVPTVADWDDSSWRTWLLWRHTVIRDYLDTLAQTAWTAGMIPFWESSTNDTPDATLLGNETAITAQISMGFSPEIEPEGDWLAAFRMAHTARDFAPTHPLIYLGWPESTEDAQHEFATALSFSNTLYLTADAPYPEDIFAFIESIQADVLNQRQPYGGNIALIYSVRNKDWDYEEGEYFSAYDDAYRDLTMAHLPFRVLVLEDLTAETLAPFATIVLPNLISISASEYALLNTRQVVTLDWENGLRDEQWVERAEPLVWTNLWSGDIDELPTSLPFEIDAPDSTYIAFYEDGTGGFYLFAAHAATAGEFALSAEDTLQLIVYRRDGQTEALTGDEITITIQGELTIVHVQVLP